MRPELFYRETLRRRLDRLGTWLDDEELNDAGRRLVLRAISSSLADLGESLLAEAETNEP